MFRALIFSLLFVCAVAIPSSPEPEIDPMGPQLYVTPAGRVKYRSKFTPTLIKNKMKICPTFYKRGFSILCEIPGRVARFYVNGKKVKVERKVPFFIAGDYGKVVAPWKSYPKYAIIMCKAGREKVVRRVAFKC